MRALAARAARRGPSASARTADGAARSAAAEGAADAAQDPAAVGRRRRWPRRTSRSRCPSVPDPIIPLRFNPTEYQLQKSNKFAEIAIPGLEIAADPVHPRRQREAERRRAARHLRHARGRPRPSTSTSCATLMRIKSELHAPPIVRFVWDRDGVPRRARQPERHLRAVHPRRHAAARPASACR